MIDVNSDNNESSEEAAQHLKSRKLRFLIARIETKSD